MSSTYEDTLFDFDLNLLNNPSANVTTIQEKYDRQKQKKAIAILKKKIVATDSLISKYYGKRVNSEEMEKTVVAYKEECKQTLIKYRDLLENNNQLQNDYETLQNYHSKCEEKLVMAQNKTEASESYANQLQLLLKEKETETSRCDNNLKKPSVKNYEKKVFEQTIETFRKDIFLFIHLIKKLTEYAKRPLKPKYDILLKTYETPRDEKNRNWGDYSDAEYDIFDDVLSQLPNNTNMVKKCSVSTKDMAPIECENDYSNEVVSVDTGRGSSLSFSDNEKCLHSPDYFLNDSPLNGENIVIKSRAKVVSTATSPIMFDVNESKSNLSTNSESHPKSLSTIDISVSPIKINKTISTSPIKNITREIATSTDEINNTVFGSLLKKITKEIATSTDEMNNTVSTSPAKKITREIATSTHEINNTFSASPTKKITKEIATSTDEINTISASLIKKVTREICTSTDDILDEVTTSNKVHTQDEQAQECLELNNSNNLCRDNHTDYEIEMIFNTMKLNFKTVSPIPRTPSTLRGEANNVTSMLSEHNEHVGTCEYCKSAQKTREQRFNELKAKIFSIEPFIFNNNIKRNNNDSTEIAHSEKIVTDSQNFLLQDSTVNQNSNWVQIDISQPKPLLLLDDNNTAIIDSNTDNLQNGNSTPELSICRLQDRSPVQLVSDKQTTDNEISTVMDQLKCSNNSVVKKQSLTKDSNTKKAKSKKITKLDKIRNILKPKYKIRRETPPLVKSRIKPTQLTLPENKITETDTSASLNDKNTYAKAVKVMAEINSQKCGVSQQPHVPIKHLSPKDNTQLEEYVDNNKLTSPKSLITTRSKRKCVELLDGCTVMLEKSTIVNALEIKKSGIQKRKSYETSYDTTRKRGGCSFESEVPSKRILRSATVSQRLSTEHKKEIANTISDQYRKSIEAPNANEIEISDAKLRLARDIPKKDHALQNQRCDLDASSEDIQPEKEMPCPIIEANTNPLSSHPKESILVTMLTLYGSETVRPFTKKIPDATVKIICEKIELEIVKIKALPLHERNNPMNRFVADLQKLNYKCLINGIIMYLNKSERKTELFAKISGAYCPAMTDAEQILLYVIGHLHWPSVDFVGALLSSIEFVLFKLNRTPEFDVIESTSHFFAVLCRYASIARSRLRTFILDALYCMQYKAIPLIKQCLEVCMQVIPLAHMGTAATPLVTCLVYLLHFYKCDDKFNRVQEIRNILSKKYFYQISDWNERKILEVFKNAILDVNDIPMERKMLRMSLIILAKRQGPQWCQNHIIKNLLQPLLEKENVSNTVKEFCVSMIGPLMKPYPVDMKVHCEIAFNQLTNILDNKPSRSMEEAAIMSMLVINRHNQYSINQMLLRRKMRPMSSNLENALRDYVRTRPLKIWKKMLPKIALS